MNIKNMKLFDRGAIEETLFEDSNIRIFEKREGGGRKTYIYSNHPFYLSSRESNGKIKKFEQKKKNNLDDGTWWRTWRDLESPEFYLWSYCFESGDGTGYDLYNMRSDSVAKSKKYLPVNLKNEEDKNYKILYRNDTLSIQKNRLTKDVHIFSKNKFSISTWNEINESLPLVVPEEGNVKKCGQIGAVPTYKENYYLSDPSVLLKIDEDWRIEEIRPVEYYEATGRNPQEFKRRGGIKEYIKESLKTDPVSRIMTYSSVVGAASLGFLYNAKSFWQYLGFLEGMSFINYIVSPYLIRKAYRVEWVDDLKDMKNAAKKLDVNLKKIGVSEWEKSNAFAYSYPILGGNVVFTKRILEKLTDEELMAVAGHEFNHIKRNDTTKLYLLSSLLLPLSGAATWTLWKDFSWLQNMSLIVGLSLFENGISRLRKKFEYDADKFAAKHFGKDAIIGALEKITPRRFKNVSSSSHPSVVQRAIALEDEPEQQEKYHDEQFL